MRALAGPLLAVCLACTANTVDGSIEVRDVGDDDTAAAADHDVVLGGGDTTAATDSDPPADPPPPVVTSCSGGTASAGTATTLPTTPDLTMSAGFQLQAIARVNGAREMAALPNGDLIVGTNGTSVYIVPHADLDDGVFKPIKFADIADAPAAGVAFDAAHCTIYVGTNHGVYAMAYEDGATTGTPGNPIALVRQSNDGGHATTSLTVAGGKLYASVGSSCNACVEIDKTRATIQAMDLDGHNMTTYAKHFRNAMAITTNPNTGTVWAGGAGQDSLPLGHPYELFDAVTAHAAGADYGWPDCEENHNAYGSGANCSSITTARVALPAYRTLIGAAFYPAAQTGAHVFPAGRRGGVFLAMHGSWHEDNDGSLYSAPSLGFLPMNGDQPDAAVDWGDPTAQWSEFVGGFQLADGQTRLARPTGLVVGAQGSLFFADDQGGLIYRIRPQ